MNSKEHEGNDQLLPASADAPRPGRYEIRVKGRLDARWAAWFDGMTFSFETGGTTTIAGPVTDQAALHGLLARIRDLGMPIVSIQTHFPTEEVGNS